MTPKEALDRVVEAAYLTPRLPFEGRPGQERPGVFLASMGGDVREPLSRLTSEEASQMDADRVVRQRV